MERLPFSFDNTMRRRTLLGAMAGMFAAACAPAASTPSTTGGSSAPSVPTAVPPRTVKTAMGEVTVPGAPQRVVVLDVVDNVLALGVTPVGGAQWTGTASGATPAFPSYLGDKVKDVKFVGTSAEPSLEVVASLRPDIILGRKQEHEKIYSQLTQIAPTTLVEQTGSDRWKDQFTNYALFLGLEAKGKEVLAAYETRAKGIATKVAAKPPFEVSLVRFDPDRIAAYNQKFFSGVILKDAGIKRIAAQDTDQQAAVVSFETLNLIDGDYLVAVVPVTNNSTFNRLPESPLWKDLKAVKNNRVLQANYETWVADWGMLSAHKVLDEVEKFFL